MRSHTCLKFRSGSILHMLLKRSSCKNQERGWIQSACSNHSLLQTFAPASSFLPYNPSTGPTFSSFLSNPVSSTSINRTYVGNITQAVLQLQKEEEKYMKDMPESTDLERQVWPDAVASWTTTSFVSSVLTCLVYLSVSKTWVYYCCPGRWTATGTVLQGLQLCEVGIFLSTHWRIRYSCRRPTFLFLFSCCSNLPRCS